MSSPPDPVAQRAALDRLDALERQKSALFADELRAAAHIHALWGDDDGVVLEVAGTARVGQQRATTMMSRGERMVHLFPTALDLLAAGVMRVGTVDILLAVSANASRQVQRELDARCSEQICLLDAADARRLVARTIPELEAELDADEQRERHERALADRFVAISPTHDGMARITADLGVLEARRFGLDLEELVRAQKVLDDKQGVVRTQGQRRADVLGKLPGLVLALAEASRKGRLADLLPEALLATVPAPSVGDAGGDDELPLDLPARTAPPCWRRDTDSLVAELLSLPVRGPSTLHLHTAMTTMLDLDERSAWLEGFGPVSAMHARILLPSADLCRVAVDARTGVPLGIDVPPNTPWFETCDWTFETELLRGRHEPPDEPPDDGPGGDGEGGPPPSDVPPGSQRESSDQARRQRARILSMLRPMYLDDRAEPQHDPSSGLRRFSQVRDMACDGPGCPRSARQCELDHEDDYARGGVTAPWNLKHRSPRCHHCKHGGWTVRHDHATGASSWTSPAGSTYERAPFWPVPASLDGKALGAPRLEPPLTVSNEAGYDVELPLWHEPLPRGARHGRVIDLSEVPDPYARPGRLARGIAEANALIEATAPQGGWAEGPPPF